LFAEAPLDFFGAKVIKQPLYFQDKDLLDEIELTVN
jgi:hypothetical protein